MTDAVIILDVPCPHCGCTLGRANVIENQTVPPYFTGRVLCEQCGAMGPRAEAPDRIFAAAHAVIAWNKRISPNPKPSAS